MYPSRIYDHGDDMQGQFRRPAKRDMLPGHDYAMFFDLGVYGIPKAIRDGEGHKYKAVTSMRRMEHFTREAGGAPFLYADTFMDREEFGAMFDLTLYERTAGNFDHFGFFLAHFSAPPHPSTALCYILLGAHADRVPIGVWNPML